MRKRLPSAEAVPSGKHIVAQLAARIPESPYDEIEHQNQELLHTLEELRARQEELAALNRELEDTNRGVVALYAELDERTDYLRRASELKSNFLSSVSHEFRTPLNSIISLSRLLLQRMDGELTAEQEKQVRYIEQSAAGLSDLVNDLLDLAKVEAGKVKIRPKRFELKELFSALKGMLKPLLADNSSVDLIFGEVAEFPAFDTDEGKLSQILRNFISNAIKFTPKGTVEIGATLKGDRAVFAVRDTGIGIALENQELIFQEFTQVENPFQARYLGTGLGLPLCRKLALLLGGTVWVESTLGSGSTFYAEIPLRYRGDLKNMESPDLPAVEFSRPPVLLIEDNPDAVKMMEQAFAASEFQLLHVSNPSDALEWLKKNRPEAIISDTHFDNAPVWNFLRSLRGDPTFERVPVVVVGIQDEGQRALAAGADAFLRKPIDSDALLQELRTRTGTSGPRNILLVEDNEATRYLVRELLSEGTLRILEAGTGADARRLCRDERIDAIILDLGLPDTSGFDLLDELRDNPLTSAIPIVVFTSREVEGDELERLNRKGAKVVRKSELSSRLAAEDLMRPLTEAGLRTSHTTA
jgi:signal transduction histidine kinase/CheY-like chemotaxis protein